jgi:hypothetical protein
VPRITPAIPRRCRIHPLDTPSEDARVPDASVGLTSRKPGLRGSTSRASPVEPRRCLVGQAQPRRFAHRTASTRQESSGPSIGPHVPRESWGASTDRGRSALFRLDTHGSQVQTAANSPDGQLAQRLSECESGAKPGDLPPTTAGLTAASPRWVVRPPGFYYGSRCTLVLAPSAGSAIPGRERRPAGAFAFCRRGQVAAVHPIREGGHR